MKKEMDDQKKLSRKEAIRIYNAICYRYEDLRNQLFYLIEVDCRILSADQFNEHTLELESIIRLYNYTADELKNFWNENKWNITFKFPIAKKHNIKPI